MKIIQKDNKAIYIYNIYLLQIHDSKTFFIITNCRTIYNINM